MKVTNVMGLPKPFVEAATSDHEYAEGRYSVTEVLGGTCEAILKRRHADDIEEDVSDRVWAIFGSAVHGILQGAQEAPEQLKENWLDVGLDGGLSGYRLSGIFDLYDDSTGTVTDYKTASVWKVQFGDYEDWRKQTLMYCWLLQQIGFDAWNGEIVALLKDHSIRKARTDKDYPQHPVHRISWHFTGKDIEDIEDEIYGWFLEAMHEETVPDECLEPCSDAQRWHKPDTYAVVKNGNKRATKVLDSEGAAEGYMSQLKEGAYHIEFREGEDTRCQSYCSVAQFCPYGRKFFQDSENSQTPSADSVL